MAPKFRPTFSDIHVETTEDALILFEACLCGESPILQRRPDEKEYSSWVKSGSVFIYYKAEGLTRWTDRVSWSPSRVLGNFLIYRELKEQVQPSDKRKVKKRNQRQPNRQDRPYARPDGTNKVYLPNSPDTSPSTVPHSASSEEVLELIGSLVDQFDFTQEAFIKKTISVKVNRGTLRLVSYYAVTEVRDHKLKTPSQTPCLQRYQPRPELEKGLKQPLKSSKKPMSAGAGRSAYGYRAAPDYSMPYYQLPYQHYAQSYPGYPGYPYLWGSNQQWVVPFRHAYPAYPAWPGYAAVGTTPPRTHPTTAEYAQNDDCLLSVQRDRCNR